MVLIGAGSVNGIPETMTPGMDGRRRKRDPVRCNKRQTKNAPDSCYRNEITVGDNGRTNLYALGVGVIKCCLRLGSTTRTQLRGPLYLPSTNGIYCYRPHRLNGVGGSAFTTVQTR